jgi:hypothetical protein
MLVCTRKGNIGERIIMITVNPLGRLRASSAAYNWMSTASALSNPSFAGGDYKKGLQMQLQLQNDIFQISTGNAMQDMNDRITKAKIKRSFSIFQP